MKIIPALVLQATLCVTLWGGTCCSRRVYVALCIAASLGTEWSAFRLWLSSQSSMAWVMESIANALCKSLQSQLSKAWHKLWQAVTWTHFDHALSSQPSKWSNSAFRLQSCWQAPCSSMPGVASTTCGGKGGLLPSWPLSSCSRKRMVMWWMRSITISFKCSPSKRISAQLEVDSTREISLPTRHVFPLPICSWPPVAVSKARTSVSCAEPWWYCWFWAQQPVVPTELCSKLLKNPSMAMAILWPQFWDLIVSSKENRQICIVYWYDKIDRNF